MYYDDNLVICLIYLKILYFAIKGVTYFCLWFLNFLKERKALYGNQKKNHFILCRICENTHEKLNEKKSKISNK